MLNEDVLETQFLIGKNIMSAPIVEKGIEQRTVYFPETTWFELNFGKEYKPKSVASITNKPKDLVPLFIRCGSILFTQHI